MTTRGEISRPLAVLIALAYVALIWRAAVSLKQQSQLQSQRRGRSSVALWRR